MAWLTLLLVVYGAVRKSWRPNIADPMGSPFEGASSHGPSGTAVRAARVGDTSQFHEIPTASTSPGRVAVCYFSTPKRMRNCFPGPQAHIFECKGQLHLEAEALVFTSPWQTRVAIPLPAISDLSIGQFQMWTTPWVMKYARFHFLSITCTEAGSSCTVHLMPVDQDDPRSAGGGAVLTQWFEAIRQAIVARTGQSPQTTHPAALAISAEPNWGRKGWPLFFGSLASLGLTCLAISQGTAGALTVILSAITSILWVASLWYTIGFLQANAALRRGDFDAVTSELQIPDPAASVPDTWFDRQWATTLVDRAVAALSAEAEAEGRTRHFALLKPWLLGEVPSLSQAEAARELDLSEGAVKVAVHRLRKRFREVVKAQIAQTVDDPTQVREELRYLVDVLAHTPPVPVPAHPRTPGS